MKNIVIIAATEFPFSTASANLLRNFGLGLIQQGSNVHLLISRGNSLGKGTEFKNRKNVYKGLKYTYCSFINKPKSYLFKILDVFFGILAIPPMILTNKLKGKVDAVIVYTGFAYQNFPVLITCKILRIPIFKYSVDFYNKESIISKWWMRPKWWMFILEMKYFDRLLNGIIAISQTIKDYYMRNGMSEKKVIIIPNIIDLKTFYGSLVQTKNEDKDLLRIGYAGAAPLLNGVDDLIKAFKIVQNKYENTELLIVGDVTGESSQLSLFKHIAEENEVLEKCIFTGRVDGKKIPEYLESCDILVMARKNTHFAQSGFPTKLGEYFATEKPVIMTNVGDIANYFADGVELMIAEADNPASVAMKIIYLIEHNEEGKKIAKNGRRWADENLDYISNSKRILTFILNHV